MVGKKGRSGRRLGSTSPIGQAGRHLNTLMELCLALAPTKREDAVLLQDMTALAEIAFRQAERRNRGRRNPLKWPPMTPENIKAVINWTKRRAPDITLRQRRRKRISAAQVQELLAKHRNDLTEAELKQLRAAAFHDLVQRSKRAWRECPVRDDIVTNDKKIRKPRG